MSLLREHLQVLRAEEKAAATIEERERVVEMLELGMPHGILYAAREQVLQWLQGPQEEGRRWSRATKFTYWGHVNGFLNFAEQEIAWYSNPLRGLRRPKVPLKRVPKVEDEELRRALTAQEPVRTAVMLAAYAGLRRFEIAGAHREHVTEDLVLIPVAKGGDQQTVPTHPALWEHLRDRPGGPLIGLTVPQLSYHVRKTFAQLGFPPWVGLHRFRRWYGTTIQEQQGDIRVTQELLRHKDVRTTQIYTAVTPRQTRAAVALLPVVRPSQLDPGSDTHPAE